MFWGNKPRIHLIGIGGSGMSGIAEVLLAQDFFVSGSDVSLSPTTERLQGLGAVIHRGHQAEHVIDADCVVVSSAVLPSNPEWQAALLKKIPVIPRAEMLAELMRLKRGIAVAGSHGKTTTTSMLGQVLASLDPTVVVGGRLQHWNASSTTGRGEIFVIEADESDRSFLKFSPCYSIVTNVDLEHLDTYRDLSDLEQTFVSFLNRTAFFGACYLSSDCESLKRIRPQLMKPVRTFGLSEDADFRATSIHLHAKGSRFELLVMGQTIGFFDLPVVGLHQIKNAAAAIAVAYDLGVPVDVIQRALDRFQPADRRLQVHRDELHATVVEDYGHHPTELRATFEAIRYMQGAKQMVTIFQLHRYSRTEALWNDFVDVLSSLEGTLYLLPIYAAHEAVRLHIDHRRMADEIQKRAPLLRVIALDALPEPKAIVSSDINTLYLVLGASPLTAFAKSLAAEVGGAQQVSNH